MDKHKQVRIAWKSRITGYKGFGYWHPIDLAMDLIALSKALDKEFPNLIHSVEYESQEPTPLKCNRPEGKMMDKRKKIAEALYKVFYQAMRDDDTDEGCSERLVEAVMAVIDEPEPKESPKRSWL